MSYVDLEMNMSDCAPAVSAGLFEFGNLRVSVGDFSGGRRLYFAEKRCGAGWRAFRLIPDASCVWTFIFGNGFPVDFDALCADLPMSPADCPVFWV